MQNMQNNMQGLKPICRIVPRLYFAYSAYICTPHFADGRVALPAPALAQHHAATALPAPDGRPARPHPGISSPATPGRGPVDSGGPPGPSDSTMTSNCQRAAGRS